MELKRQRDFTALFFLDQKKQQNIVLPDSTNSITCIQSSNDFYELKDDWNKLVDKSINPHPFILWEWMYTWWETYNDKSKKLFLLAYYEANELVAIAPFYIKYKTPYIARLSMLGEGERESDRIVTHYPDVIVNKQHRKRVVSAFSKYLKENVFSGKTFFYASFNLILENSVIQDIGLQLSDSIHHSDKNLENQFRIDLPVDENDYVASLSKSTRKQFRLKLSRLEKAGEVEIRSEQNLDKGLRLIEDLHRKRWESKSKQCVFDSTRFYTFHKNLCRRFQQQDIVSFRTLNHNNIPIAATYNLNYNSTCYSYLSGFHSVDDKRLSPMFIFDILEIKNMIINKNKHYDLLVSEAENNYKLKYGSKKHPVHQILWLDKGVIAIVILAYLNIRPYLAKAYQLLTKFKD